MKTKNSIISLLFAIAAAFTMSGCGVFEKETFIEVDNTPPAFTDASPSSAPRYSEVTLTGTNLQKVEKVLLGDEQLPIKYRISDTEMVVVVDGTKNGVFTACTTIDKQPVETVSEVGFTYTYVAPEITQLPVSMEVGSAMLIRGSNMMATESVWIVDSQNPASKVRAQIQSRSTTEVIVRVPYVTFDAGKVAIGYYNGTTNVETTPGGEAINVVIYEPSQIWIADPAVEEGEELNIDGIYLDKVEKVTIGGKEVPISFQSATNLKVIIPASLFPDGDNPGLSINLIYFDGQADVTVANNINIYVPEVIRGRNQTIVAQGRVGILTSFFNLNTGMAVHNSGFASLDPVALRYTGSGWAATTCTAQNVIDKTKVSEADYNSVPPYFYLRNISTNGGTVQLTGPTNTQSGLRAFYFAGSGNASNILGEANRSSDCAGTPVVMFLALSNAPTAPAAEKAVYDAIRGGSLLKIDASTFPIDKTANTVGGISLMNTAETSASRLTGSPGQDNFAPGYLRGDGNVTDLATKGQDGVVMVVYYNYADGYTAANPANGIVRIGFIHVKGFFWDSSHAAGDARNSIATFDTYWQKYDNE